MSYQIEKGHSIPEPHRGPLGPRGSKYPFADMAVGDSFLVTDEKEQNGVASSAQRYGKMHDARFITRRRNMAEHGEEGVRVWRVDPAEFPYRPRPKVDNEPEGNGPGF